MKQGENPKWGRGSIIRRGKSYVYRIRDYSRPKPRKLAIVLGTVDELPTIEDAWAAVEIAGHPSVLSVMSVIRNRGGNGKDKPRFSATWYARKLREQKGRCAICGIVPKRFVVDHNHDDDTLRGLLCVVCNSGIGMLRDDIATLRAAVAYLESYELPEEALVLDLDPTDAKYIANNNSILKT